LSQAEPTGASFFQLFWDKFASAKNSSQVHRLSLDDPPGQSEYEADEYGDSSLVNDEELKRDQSDKEQSGDSQYDEAKDRWTDQGKPSKLLANETWNQ
jgi:hypothetical protein